MARVANIPSIFSVSRWLTRKLPSDPIRIDLPSPPDLGIDQGLLAATERRAFGDSDQLLGLSRQQRQGNGTDTFDLEARRENLAGTHGTKIAGMLDSLQQSGEINGKGWHAIARSKSMNGLAH
jgi:hypothetical protein